MSQLLKPRFFCPSQSALHSYKRHTDGLMSLDQLHQAAFIQWGVVREIRVRLWVKG